MRETHRVIDQSEFSFLTEWRIFIGRLHTYYICYSLLKRAFLRFHVLSSTLFQLKKENQQLDLQGKESLLERIN